jgi:hypothetical protein
MISAMQKQDEYERTMKAVEAVLSGYKVFAESVIVLAESTFTSPAFIRFLVLLSASQNESRDD